MKLSDSVKYVKGVGPKMAERLEHLGIRTVEALISFYPRRYQDWTQITKMEDLVSGEESVIYGRILDVKEIHPRKGLSILNVTMTDGTGAERPCLRKGRIWLWENTDGQCGNGSRYT